MQGIAQLSAGRRLQAVIIVGCALHGCAQSVPVSTTSSADLAIGATNSSTTPAASTPAPAAPPSPPGSPTSPGSPAPPVTPAPPIAPPVAPPPTAVGTATLTWVAPSQNTDGTPLDDLAGYRIYYGTSLTQLSLQATLDGTATTYVANGLGTGTYYFAVTALSSQGTESAFSNLAGKTF